VQDRVPPFPDAQASACIEAAFGAPPSAVFSQLSPNAVAAASLGQVYRGTLRSTGRDVAIKVGGWVGGRAGGWVRADVMPSLSLH
jgi:aarF domain-containing kinase